MRLLTLVIATVLGAAVVVDRVAVIVGTRVVKASDIERDLRASQMLNREPVNLSSDARRKVAVRLIDQELIRQEIANGGYRQPSRQDVDGFLAQLRRDRFSGSDAQLRSALKDYGISEAQFREYLLWQLTVLRFIDERFRPGVLVTDEDVRAYSDEHRADLKKDEPKIREIITGERVNQLFEEWLEQARRRVRVEYRDGAFQEGKK